MSPEQCAAKQPTGASDQYSLGVVAYEMLTGKLPFVAESVMAMMYAQIHTPPEPLSKKRPDLPRDVNAAIMRMLAKNPEDRWPSVKDAVAAIAAVAPPVDEDVRARIIALARNRPDRAAIEFRTPPSPAPPPRRTPSQPPEGFVERRVSGGNTPPQIQIIHKAAAWPMVVGGILALVAGGFYWQTRSQASAAQQQDSLTATTTTMGDSLWLEARGKADLARQNALSAGVKPAALTSGDSLRALAESLAGTGQKAQGAVLLTQAVTAWQSVEATARRPAPTPPRSIIDSQAVSTAALVPPESLPNRPVVTVPRVVTDSQGAAVLPDSQQVGVFYDRLAGFIAARQLGEMQRLRANMTSSEEQRWLDLFQDEKVEGVHVVFTVLGVSAQAGRIYAGCDTIRGHQGWQGRNEEEQSARRVDPRSGRVARSEVGGSSLSRIQVQVKGFESYAISPSCSTHPPHSGAGAELRSDVGPGRTLRHAYPSALVAADAGGTESDRPNQRQPQLWPTRGSGNRVTVALDLPQDCDR